MINAKNVAVNAHLVWAVASVRKLYCHGAFWGFSLAAQFKNCEIAVDEKLFFAR